MVFAALRGVVMRVDERSYYWSADTDGLYTACGLIGCSWLACFRVHYLGAESYSHDRCLGDWRLRIGMRPTDVTSLVLQNRF